MKMLFAAVAVCLPLVACASADPTRDPAPEQTGKTDQAAKVCPYAVPYCDLTHCKLVGGCPEQCVCDNGASTQCGPSLHCGPNQYCCDSTTVGYECLSIGQMCPL